MYIASCDYSVVVIVILFGIELAVVTPVTVAMIRLTVDYLAHYSYYTVTQ